GWSGKIFAIVAQIAAANQARGGGAIVVFDDRDKVDMEEAMRAHGPNLGRTRVVVRSGDPMDFGEVEIGSPHTARSIIVLAPDEADDPDSIVIKTALAVTNNPGRKTGNYHIVGEIRDPANLEPARLV